MQLFEKIIDAFLSCYRLLIICRMQNTDKDIIQSIVYSLFRSEIIWNISASGIYKTWYCVSPNSFENKLNDKEYFQPYMHLL